jgi:hypothetical protein
MTVTMSATITCDVCGRAAKLDEQTVYATRAIAHQLGWRRSTKNRDRCPQCVAQYKRVPAKPKEPSRRRRGIHVSTPEEVRAAIKEGRAREKRARNMR